MLFPPPEKLPDMNFDMILTKLALWITILLKEPLYCTEVNIAFKKFIVPFHPDSNYLEKTGYKCSRQNV
jgi:hypothetical protein